MTRYMFKDYGCSPHDANWLTVLSRAYAAGIQPVCCCKQGDSRPALYIARHLQSFIIKRMPLSAWLHAPHCLHYEPPPELSGLGQVNGSAIRVDPQGEGVTLSLDFAMNKGRYRVTGQGGEVEHESVRSDGTKLTLRAVLHYLYDEAGLTRWSAGMGGKRSWFVVRRELLGAALGKQTKGSPLSELLYVPETFFLDTQREIKERQLAALSRLSLSPGNRMMVLGEVKLFEPARFGHILVLKHMPDVVFTVDDGLYKRLEQRFSGQRALRDYYENSHLLLMGTFSLSPQGLYQLESACLMNVNEQWIPFEDRYEFELLDRLHYFARRFAKGLRYNLLGSKPLASVVLQDTGDTPTAMYIVPAGEDAAYGEAVEALNGQTGMASWVWQTGIDAMPELPGRVLGSMERP